ncbi:MAG: hypothetical protein ACOYUZ_02410 [Patescibacteria group bacterium]
MKIYFRIFCVLIALTMTLPRQALFAQEIPGLRIDSIGFNPNFILTDDDIFDINGMNYDYLKNFLRSKGRLADLKVMDTDGEMKPAVDIIWRVSNVYKINPKYLVALLQKEQSLVEDPDPSERQLDWATGYAVCDSCSKDDPDIQDFRGFANQLEYAARQHREKYLMQLLTTGTTIAGKGMGISMNIDGIEVIPQNKATAMLYSYTPHIHGNKVLWTIWQRWFALTYPTGTIIKGMPSENIYLIQNGQKREFESINVLLSMTSLDKVLEASDSELSSYANGDPMKFPKYSLLRVPQGTIYLLASDGKRRISSMEVFRKFGFIEDEIIHVEDEDVTDIPDAEAINEETVFPQGALVKSDKSSTVWYVENGKKYALLDEVFLKLYFTRRPIKTLPQEEIDGYKDSGFYSLHNGELVKGDDPTVFVVEDSVLRPIASGEVFESLGWKWQNIVNVPDRVLLTYQTGDPVKLQNRDITEENFNNQNLETYSQISQVNQ